MEGFERLDKAKWYVLRYVPKYVPKNCGRSSDLNSLSITDKNNPTMFACIECPYTKVK